MTEKEFREMLQGILEQVEHYYDDEEDIVHLKDINTFQSAGLLTYSEGLIVKMSDSSEFQVTIVKVK